MIRNYFPTRSGLLGHDYSLFFPRLLDGYFWFMKNGAFAVPWHTPSFCGGLPNFGSPQSIYYSVPQILTFSFNPVTSVLVTAVIFSALGFAGFYLLLRRSFRAGRSVSIYGGTLFMFNSFFIFRMVVGHMTYHAVMLFPLICWFLTRDSPDNRPGNKARTLFYGIIAGILVSYMFYAGMPQIMPQAIVATTAVGLVHIFMTGEWKDFGVRFLVLVFVSVAVSAAKLIPALVYLQRFPRDYYPLITAKGPAEALYLLFRPLFFYSDVSIPPLGIHEFALGVTPGPFAIISILGAAELVRIATERGKARRGFTSVAAAIMLTAILLFPLALNFKNFLLNAIVSLPLFKSHYFFFRWYLIYIPITILAACLLLDRGRISSHCRTTVVAVGLAIILAFNSHRVQRQDEYTRGAYSPTSILTAYEAAKEGRLDPRIQQIVFKAGPSRDDALVYGKSQGNCQEALFGYNMEKFPRTSLHEGSPLAVIGGRYNMINPACYIFASPNGCEPGDHFKTSRRAELESFRNYHPFEFEFPLWQKAANLITLVSLLLSLMYVLLYTARMIGQVTRCMGKT